MESPSRYLIGIDLGTTNCAVAYIDTNEPGRGPSSSGIRVFEVTQLTGPVKCDWLHSYHPFFISQLKTKFPRAQ
jgi:hypothetical protein